MTVIARLGKTQAKAVCTRVTTRREGTTEVYVGLPGSLWSLANPWVLRRVLDHLTRPEVVAAEAVALDVLRKGKRQLVWIRGEPPYRIDENGTVRWRDPARQAEWDRETGAA